MNNVRGLRIYAVVKSYKNFPTLKMCEVSSANFVAHRRRRHSFAYSPTDGKNNISSSEQRDSCVQGDGRCEEVPH
jgi:hypothetical protein